MQYSHNDPGRSSQTRVRRPVQGPRHRRRLCDQYVRCRGHRHWSPAGEQAGIRSRSSDSTPVPPRSSSFREGTVQALIAQQPDTIGTDGVEQAVNALNDRPVTKDISTGFHMITADNIDGEGANYIYKSSC